HVAVLVQHTAVAVVGVFVQARVGHQHGVVAQLGTQVAQRDVQDAVGAAGGRPDRVMRGGHTEEHQPAHPGGDRFHRGLAQRIPGVVHDAGHAGDRPRLGDSLGHAQRQDQLARPHLCLADQPPYGGGAAQPTGSMLGKHSSNATPSHPLDDAPLTWTYAAKSRCASPQAQPTRAPERLGDHLAAARSTSPLMRPAAYFDEDEERRRLVFRGGGRAPSARSLAACAASSSTSTVTRGWLASTSTRRPNSCAVSAVFGPMQATSVRACGLPAMPTRFRTVDAEVKHTASNPPVLIISRVSAGGGAARTVRYAVTSSTSQPRSVSPADSVSVAMSARGNRMRLTGSSTSSYGGNSLSMPSLDCSPCGIISGVMPNARTRSAVASPMQPI